MNQPMEMNRHEMPDVTMVRPKTNIPIPTSDCHGYQIACLCGIECPKFIEAYELGVRDNECAIFDENMEEIDNKGNGGLTNRQKRLHNKDNEKNYK